MKLIREDRRATVHRLHPRVVNNVRPPSDPPPGNPDGHAPIMASSGTQPDSHRWRESKRHGSAKATLSLGNVSTSHLPDDERIVSFHNSSMSSDSSTFSTDRPFTPTPQPMVTPNTLPLQFDSKPAQASNSHIVGYGPHERSLVDSSAGSGFEATCPNEGCYQCSEHTIHPDLTQNQQYAGVNSEQQGYLGSDGLLHLVYSAPIRETGQPPPVQGHNYPYPNNTPYSYS